MEFRCETCKYSKAHEKSALALICDRIKPLQISDDIHVLEYMIDCLVGTQLVVFVNFCCIKWEPKEGK